MISGASSTTVSMLGEALRERDINACVGWPHGVCKIKGGLFDLSRDEGKVGWFRKI